MTPHFRPLTSLSTPLALLIIGLTTLAGCGQGRVAYTNKLRSHYYLSTQEVRSVQFYLSSGLNFYRIVGPGDKTISPDHTLIRRDNETYEEIEIKSGTPGVVLWADNNKLAVSFEKGSYLVFTNIQISEYGEPMRDSFVEQYSVFRLLNAVKPTTILYTCATYSKDCKQGHKVLLRDGYLEAHLLVSREDLENLKRKHSVQKGRLVK